MHPKSQLTFRGDWWNYVGFSLKKSANEQDMITKTHAFCMPGGSRMNDWMDRSDWVYVRIYRIYICIYKWLLSHMTYGRVKRWSADMLSSLYYLTML